MSYSVLIIGLGKIALGFDLDSAQNNIFSHTKAFLSNDAFELVGGVDVAVERRVEFEEYSGKSSFASVDEAFCFCPKIDVISICTPSDYRLSVFMEILKFNPKLVLIEKPIALDLSEALQIKQVAEKHKIKLFVNYIRRVEPYYASLADVFDGKFILPSKVIVHYTGGLFTNASHFINLMLFYFGRPYSIFTIDVKPLKSDYSADFIMHYDDFKIIFVGHTDIEYSLGEIDIVCLSSRYLIYDWGFKTKTYELAVDPMFPDLKTLNKAKCQPIVAMNVYMKHSVDHMQKLLEAGCASDDLNDAIATTEICEYIKNATESA